MKVLAIGRLRNANHEEMRAGLALFEKQGVAGLETMWLSSDAKTIVALYEVDSPADLHKYGALYAPYFESMETHLVSDIPTGTAALSEGLSLAP
jgi:hypothetical protein